MKHRYFLPHIKSPKSTDQMLWLSTGQTVSRICVCCGICVRLTGFRSASLPLGIPITADVPEVLHEWFTANATRAWGFRSPTCALVSCSVEMEEVERLARAAPIHVPCVARRVEEVLQPAAAPVRVTTDVVQFTDGVGQLLAWHPSDREALGGDTMGRSFDQRSVYGLKLYVFLHPAPYVPRLPVLEILFTAAASMSKVEIRIV